MMKILLILIICSIFIVGCSNDKEINNMRICQEACLESNMSYNSLETFSNSTDEFLQCTCNLYVESD